MHRADIQYALGILLSAKRDAREQKRAGVLSCLVWSCRGMLTLMIPTYTEPIVGERPVATFPSFFFFFFSLGKTVIIGTDEEQTGSIKFAITTPISAMLLNVCNKVLQGETRV